MWNRPAILFVLMIFLPLVICMEHIKISSSFAQLPLFMFYSLLQSKIGLWTNQQNSFVSSPISLFPKFGSLECPLIIN